MKHPKRLSTKIDYDNGAVVKPLTRRQMAVFLAKTFGLTLYAP